MNYRKDQRKTLGEVYESVDTTSKKTYWGKLLAFVGPAYLVSVGYMDPGNWATDIAGGSRFGYALIWVLLMSNLMALLLQSLSARLGIVTRLDLAQACRQTYHPAVNFGLYILAEIAIAACDLAEVLGMAIGLNLLFGLPLIIGVSITVLDTLLLLVLMNYGMRRMEAFILSMVFMIGLAFCAEIFFARPDLPGIMSGFIPSLPGPEALYIAMGIIGATVMPHNLYLHSSLVQTRRIGEDMRSIRDAIRFNVIDSAIALNAAFFVNSSILILAAAVFHKNALFEVADISDAHRLLEPLLGNSLAPALFAIALIIAGQSSTITGTLAGQIVMEGYLNLRIAPWLRRLLTRLLAVIPALFTIIYFGEQATGELLILSQVILSLQLGFAVIPLVHLVSDKEKMGTMVIAPWIKAAAWTSAAIIVTLNIKLVTEEMTSWLAAAGEGKIWIQAVVIPLALLLAGLLAYVTFMPWIKRIRYRVRPPHGEAGELGPLTAPDYRRVAVAVDFSEKDRKAITHALSQGGKKAEFLLIHIVESAGAFAIGKEVMDMETGADRQYMDSYIRSLTDEGYRVSSRLDYGNPKRLIPAAVEEFGADLLVMGAHGHSGLKDLIFGETVSVVRHRVKVPVLVVK